MYPLMEILKLTGFYVMDTQMSEEMIQNVKSSIQDAKKGKLVQRSAFLENLDTNVNTVYKNNLGSGVMQVFLQCTEAQMMNHYMGYILEGITGLDWKRGVNNQMLPITIHTPASFLQAHREPGFGYASNDLLCVLMMSDPNTNFSEGQLYLNSDENDPEETRHYFNLQYGQMIVFDNQRFVHGTEPLKKGSYFMASWRTSKSFKPRAPARASTHDAYKKAPKYNPSQPLPVRFTNQTPAKV